MTEALFLKVCSKRRDMYVLNLNKKIEVQRAEEKQA